MHELSIAMAVVDMAEEEAERRGGRVAAVHLKIGPLSGVVPDALRSAFALAREATALADAELIVEEVPIAAYCPVCVAERPVASVRQLCCATCGTPTPRVVRGRELEVVALEIAT